MQAYFKGQPISGERGPAGPDGNPVGTVISFMGIRPPVDYLLCDGSEHDISTYPILAQFFKEQFGTVNHFGGDGVKTFSVPDLRNLFLRGYHGDSDEELSGEIGQKQEATEQFAIMPTSDSLYALIHPEQEITNGDTVTYRGGSAVYGNSKSSVASYPYSYTARPVNAAVLYCIKTVDAPSVPTEYDTDDGWHIRKWSDGYVEMTLEKTIVSITINRTFGSVYNAPEVSLGDYPFELTRMYGEHINFVASSSSWLSLTEATTRNRLTTSPSLWFFGPTSRTIDAVIYYTVTGRWK